MDESKPPIPPSDFPLWSASERIPAAIDPAPAQLVKSPEGAAFEPQSRYGRIEACQNDAASVPAVAVYYRNEAEVRDGFLIALRAMGIAIVEQRPEPTSLPIRGAKP